MLKAEKQQQLGWIIERYVGWRLRRMFHAITLSGPTDLLQDVESYPLVLYANHQSWWDGFLLVPLFKRYEIDYYVMMEERNLRKFPLFRSVGVFGVDLETSAGQRASLLYAARLLRGAAPGKRLGLALFPHGRLVDSAEPWPPFAPGLEMLAKTAGRGLVLPFYIHLRFGKYPQPEAFLRLGEPVSAEPTRGLVEFEEGLALARAALFEELLANPESGAGLPLLPPRRWFHGKT